MKACKKISLIVSVVILNLNIATAICEAETPEELIKLLASKESSRQEMAKKELIGLRDKALPILKEYLYSIDKENHVRYQIVEILSEIDVAKSTDLLEIIAADTREKESIRSLALNGLTGRKVKSNIFIKLLNDGNRGLRLNSIKLIDDDTQNAALIDALKERLIVEKDWRIRKDIVSKISKLSNLEPQVKGGYILKVFKEEYVSPLPINEVSGEGVPEGPRTGLKYIYDLVNIGSAVIPVLEEDLATAKDEAKEGIIIALGLLGEKKYLSLLSNIALNSKDGWNRAYAIRSLGEIGDKSSIALLTKALNDAFSVNRSSGDVSPPPGFEYMNKYYPVRQEAFFALTKMGMRVVQKGSGPDDYHEYIILDEEQQ